MVINDAVLLIPGGANVVMNEADGVAHLVEEEVKELTNVEIIDKT